ncbi:diaminopimelate epimerase [Emcibacter sp. SYSU 3D8]|uniref:diaminopimelate epimerase n=1 Tax=Emcibacter sp. SYSU 3D8 TaxID=3133969 RepID=UPI0031FE7A14
MNALGTVRNFVKMHGLGNDFVVFDARMAPLALTPEQARFVADRHRGIGCDQIITILPSEKADAFMRIQNADGSEVSACGNATRCVASLLMGESGRDRATIETRADLLRCELEAVQEELVSVDMGEPRFGWREIPLAREADTLSLVFAKGPLEDPACVNVGNPHVVFFVDNATKIDLATWGPRIETDPMFPERINVGIAQVISTDEIRLRVWERGVGITQACGTAACAAAVAAMRRGLTDREIMVQLDGGPLEITWTAENRIIMRGPVATSFSGQVML